ncbi:MAG: class I SAM-dependent methyltransferase [Halanaeroarchaeum sp.]
MSDVESFVRFCESEFGDAVMEREAAYLNERITRDDRIVNVGSGIGSLEERFPDHEMIGVDRSEEMIRAARGRVSAPFIVGDATALPLATGSVDAVVFVSTLEFIPDAETALAEATRVLSADGTFVALVLNTRSEYVRSNLQREGSYFQRMVHQDTEALTDAILNRVDGEREFFLGISDEEVFESTDPGVAAIAAVVGTPI